MGYRGRAAPFFQKQRPVLKVYAEISVGHHPWEDLSCAAG